MDTLVETLQAKHVCYTTLELGKRIYIWFSSPVKQIGVCVHMCTSQAPLLKAA